ncbi:MAG TPA: hypothetical protein VK785_03125 [Opitutaceae bacterium]|nr:hypothetical protein [Opitutaceae bacterium]
MIPAHISRRCTALLALMVASVATPGARAVELTPGSPFMPPDAAGGANATTANAPLELRGILATPNGYKFNLCDAAGHVNVWLGLNAAGQPFVVRAQDIAHNSVTVEYQGRQLTLSLPQPKITASAAPMQQPPMMGQPPILPQAVGGNTPVVNEQQRLERIAEEIRRRRALRAGMQQPLPQPGQPELQPQFQQQPPLPQQ